MKRVYDSRTGETLFEGEVFECIRFINENFHEEDNDFFHIWIEDMEV
ncbi:hypothetical protein [Bacillus smithii]|nr:hypothetical protein [Bacillus smithii]MED4929169.1 hypothetical protein [Bacillus smithii]